MPAQPVQIASSVQTAQVPQIVAAAPPRVLSIDVLRGITIAFMILVNDPGDGAHTYTQLEHARWNGLTLTDLVFPNFLFLVGASIILSLSARMERSPTGTLDSATRQKLAFRILRRAATIFFIDLFLSAMPLFHLTTLRIYGVLTRIAICYLVVGLLCLVTRRISTLLAISAALLVGYWAIMRFVPVPGFGVPTHHIPLLDPDRNLAAWLDRGVNAFLQRTLHTGRLYEHTRDPEGLLSTLPALVTTILGSITALWLRRSTTMPASSETSPNATGAPQNRVLHPPQPHREGCGIEQSSTAPALIEAAAPLEATSDSTQLRSLTELQTLRGLLIAAVLCLAAGRLWDLTFPINKNLWTSSYVFFAAGCSLLGLALCYWLIDILHLQHRSHTGRALLWPWLVFGSNAITAYAMSNVFVKLFALIKVHDSWNPDPTRQTTAWHWIYQHIFARGHSTENTSLAFVALCFLPNLLLWRKRIFLKV